MKTAKDLIIPFSWKDRKPIFLDRFFYVPALCPYTKELHNFFDTDQPLHIEYCSGNGQWIVDRAKENPDANWIAVEKKFERARKIWLKMHRENVTNIHVVCADGLTFAKFYAPPAKEIFVNFPDPWPKLRHAKHRIIREEFLKELLHTTHIKGKITTVTDDAKYAKQMRKEFAKCPEWSLLFHVNEWPSYGNSFFKDQWEKEGRVIHYITHERVC